MNEKVVNKPIKQINNDLKDDIDKFYYSLINIMIDKKDKKDKKPVTVFVNSKNWPVPNKLKEYYSPSKKLKLQQSGLTMSSIFKFLLGIAGMKEQYEGNEKDQELFEEKLCDVFESISNELEIISNKLKPSNPEYGEKDIKNNVEDFKLKNILNKLESSKSECGEKDIKNYVEDFKCDYNCFDVEKNVFICKEECCSKCCIIMCIYKILETMSSIRGEFVETNRKRSDIVKDIVVCIDDLKKEDVLKKYINENVQKYCDGIVENIKKRNTKEEDAIEKIYVFITYLSLIDNANSKEIIYQLSGLICEFLDVQKSTRAELLFKTVSTRFYIFMNYVQNICVNGSWKDVREESRKILDNVKKIIDKIKNKPISDTFVKDKYIKCLETEKNASSIFSRKCDLKKIPNNQEITGFLNKHYPVVWNIFTYNFNNLMNFSAQEGIFGFYDGISSKELPDVLLYELSDVERRIDDKIDNELLNVVYYKNNWDKICFSLKSITQCIEKYKEDCKEVIPKYNKVLNKCEKKYNNDYVTIRLNIMCYRNKLIYMSKYCMCRLGYILKNKSQNRFEELKEIINLMNLIVDFYLDEEIQPGREGYECEKRPLEKSGDCQKFVLTNIYIMSNRLLSERWRHRPVVIFDVSFYMVVKNIYDYILEIIFKHDLDKSLLDEISRLKGYIDYFEKYFIDESIYEKCVIKPNEFDLLDISKSNPERELNIANEAVENICKYVEEIKGEFNSAKLEKYFLDHDSNISNRDFEDICKYAEIIRNKFPKYIEGISEECTIKSDEFEKLRQSVADIKNISSNLIVELIKECDKYKEKDYHRVSQLEVYIDIFNKIYNITSQLGAYIYYFRNYLLNYSISNIENREKINEYIENEKDTLSEKLLSIMTEGKSKKG